MYISLSLNDNSLVNRAAYVTYNATDVPFFSPLKCLSIAFFLFVFSFVTFIQFVEEIKQIVMGYWKKALQLFLHMDTPLSKGR